MARPPLDRWRFVPSGCCPALAQSGPDYRALVCVFLFGGNDSNNTVVPMDDASFKAYTSIRGNLALSTASLTAPVTSVSGAPYAFHAQAGGNGKHVLEQGTGGGGERRVAGAAADARAISALSRRPFHRTCFRTPISSCSGRHRSRRGTAPPDGPAGRRITSQRRTSTLLGFPAFFSVAGNSLQGAGANTQPVALSPGQSLQLTGFNDTPQSQARWNALNSLLNTEQRRFAGAGGQRHAVAQHRRRDRAWQRAGEGHAAEDGVPEDEHRRAACSRWRRSSRCRPISGMRRQIFFCSLGGFDTHTDEMQHA